MILDTPKKGVEINVSYLVFVAASSRNISGVVECIGWEGSSFWQLICWNVFWVYSLVVVRDSKSSLKSFQRQFWFLLFPRHIGVPLLALLTRNFGEFSGVSFAVVLECRFTRVCSRKVLECSV